VLRNCCASTRMHDPARYCEPSPAAVERKSSQAVFYAPTALPALLTSTRDTACLEPAFPPCWLRCFTSGHTVGLGRLDSVDCSDTRRWPLHSDCVFGSDEPSYPHGRDFGTVVYSPGERGIGIRGVCAHARIAAGESVLSVGRVPWRRGESNKDAQPCAGSLILATGLVGGLVLPRAQ
jgi:hypothetical protein